MADNAIIGALRVVLGADSAQLEDGFKRAQKSADTFGKDLAVAAAAVGTAVAAMATALGVSIKHAIDNAPHGSCGQRGYFMSSHSDVPEAATNEKLDVERNRIF